jgi:hypothetical protein
MPLIIGIVGKKQVGKNTVADFLMEKYPNAMPFAFGDKLKQIISYSLELNLACMQDPALKEVPLIAYQKHTPRQIMQQVGDCLKIFDPDIFTWPLLDLAAKYPDDLIIITDVRFPAEAKIINELGGSLVRVCRKSLITQDKHISEQACARITTDYVVENNGTIQQLKASCDNVLAALIKDCDKKTNKHAI